jgi:putative transposase
MVVRKRLNLTGPAIAFITTTVFEWKPVLTQDNVVKILIQEFHNLANLYEVSILSYVIMSSHIHALFGFPKIEALSKTIQMFKSIISRQVKVIKIPELKENEYKLWKPRFDDLIITTEKLLKIKMDYIHNNPVKAGLAANAVDWEYSSAVDWLTDKEGLIKIDKEYHWLVR